LDESEDEDEEKKKESDGFTTKLVAQIIKNLQVHLTNIHICYEDRITCSFPFQFGFTLHKLVFQTTDEKTSSLKMNKNENIVHKLITLEFLAFYWNCNQVDLLYDMESFTLDQLLHNLITSKSDWHAPLGYILSPINLTANAIIHRKPEEDHFKIPIADVDLKLDFFSLRFSRIQFKSLMMLLDSMDRMKLAMPFRKWRPIGIPVSGHAMKWWKFAVTSVIETDIKRRINNWSWEKMKQHRKLLKSYKANYVRKLMGKSSDCEEIERNLDVFSIVLVRGEAEMEVKQMRLEMKKEDKKEKKGWLSGWWGKKDNESQDDKQVC